MNKIICTILFFIPLFGCKFRVVEIPFARPYLSIADSKKSNAFIKEYEPESSYIKLGGKNYYIKEAWLEHPHTSGHFTDTPIQDSCFAMSLFTTSNKIDSTTDLHSYVKEMGNGNLMIWFFLPWKDCTKDTIVIHYRETLDSSKMTNEFLLTTKDNVRIN